jgi:rod shape-determining protein MreC
VQKKFIFSYLIIFALILIVLGFSRHNSEKMRGSSIALLAPFWEHILSFKHFLFHPSKPSPFASLSAKEEQQRLQLENQLLKTEIAYLQKELNEQSLLFSRLEQLSTLSSEDSLIDYQKTFKRKNKILNWRLNAIPARVIFRSFDTWNSSLWINVGETNNTNQQNPSIALNSPVVIGCAIVGVIDYVGNHYSRVRLITDNLLTPSVRAARGGEQDFLMSEQIQSLLQQMNRKKPLLLRQEDQTSLIQLLNQLKNSLQPLKKTWYLAKGELLGMSSPSRFGQNITLKGTGFNYDFADEEGDSRDLRNGKSFHHPQEQSIQILKLGDILVTTGMDGIFPPGFQVATVTRVGLLKEGDYFYTLEAQPIAIPMEELALVFVLPPNPKSKG